MKELSIEEKAQRYDEALQKAKHALDCDTNGLISTDKIVLLSMFPELKERGERIRKELIELISCMHDADHRKKDWIAWLERQGDKDKLIEEISEPKFKVGEWIINKEKKEVFYIRKNLANTYEIVDIEGDDYHIPHYAVEKNCYLWAMQDAKNGDVLITDNVIFIFNNIHGVWVNCHCSLHEDGSFMEKDYDLMTIKHCTDVQPATKERRDLFFQKVKEAGYEWDAEKKVLKKIEDESENYKQETLCDKCRKLQPFYSCQDIISLGRCAFGNL